MKAISLTAVEKTFSRGKPNQYAALRDVSLDVMPGQTTVLAGPSGSGKTTLLALMGLMSRPTAGRVRILEKETTLLGENLRTAFRRRHIGFIFQHFQLISDLNVKDNLDLALYPDGLPFTAIRAKRDELLEKFGLAGKAKCKTSILSGGEKQRVAIARAMMHDPEILVVDEPTAHLDSTLSHTLISVFKDLCAEGKTLIIASHDPLILDSGLPQQILHLRDGRVMEE